MTDAPVIAGAFVTHPLAAEFARAVQRVHYRYAREVVSAFALCPFMNDPESAFGRFVVMLDRELELDAAVDQVLTAPGVVHLIYPLFEGSAASLERFGNALHEAVRKRAFAAGKDAPVHATFHPAMDGDASSAARVVGFLRRAPDPFIQFVPEGLAKGGTQFVDPQTVDLAALVAEQRQKRGLFERLSSSDLAAIARLQADIRAERDASYARFLGAL